MRSSHRSGPLRACRHRTRPQRHPVGNAIVGGWQMGMILTLQTGFPITVTNGLDTSNTGALFDRPDWDTASRGFRNRLEGWLTASASVAPGLHNRVHVWVGGDMGPATSPNPPHPPRAT